MKKFVVASLMAVFGASAAFAANNPAIASAASSCCDAFCCALGLPCC